ncbi:MAG: MFS transporter [Candidatus Hydrogenedentes bacterium]|nr:MFS transporter [Candidatus Hydrogenedentota bacterium]
MSSPLKTAYAFGGNLSHDQRIWRWRILISTYLAYIGYYFCRKVYGLVKTSLNEQFGWEWDALANVWTAYLIAYLIGQFANGFLGRKWGPRVLLLGGLGTSIICNLVFASTSSYWLFMSFMIFNGLVQATGWPASVGGVSHWLRPLERGRIMGVWSTSFITGNLLVKLVGASLLGLTLAALPGWRWSYLGCTFVGFCTWWLVYFWQRDRPEDAGLPRFVDADADEEGRAVRVATKEHITIHDYLKLALNPLIITMGAAYFSIKFLRYAIDSWLPTFLYLQGLSKTDAGYYAMLFDLGGIVPAILTGWILDRYFKGNWARLCFFASVGLIVGCVCVLRFEQSPYLVALSFGLVGFMLYGPDTLLCGAASVAVAGERNGVAVAGLVNGIGSFGTILQEQIIGRLMKGEDTSGEIHTTYLVTLGLSILFALAMFVVMWRVRVAHAQNQSASAEPEAAK